MKLRSIIACLFVVAVTSTTAVAAPGGGTGAIARAVGNCGNPCTIVRNTGGRIIDFEDAGDAIRSGKQRLVIDGYCASACMVMADRARPRTCITSRAVFGYHKTNFGRPSRSAVICAAGSCVTVAFHGSAQLLGRCQIALPGSSSQCARIQWLLFEKLNSV